MLFSVDDCLLTLLSGFDASDPCGVGWDLYEKYKNIRVNKYIIKRKKYYYNNFNSFNNTTVSVKVQFSISHGI